MDTEQKKPRKKPNTDYVRQLSLLPPPAGFERVDGAIVRCKKCGASLKRRTLESTLGKHVNGHRHRKSVGAL